ncbi:tRNA isopentenyltransferase, partial [mine drainage metagenome]
MPVAVYQELAFQAIAEIRRRGRVPIVCGGSGMYVRAALGEWRFEGSSPDRDLRRELRALSSADLHLRLVRADRHAAAHLSPADRPRILRAMERLHAGTAPQKAVSLAMVPHGPILKFGLYVPRGELYRRIDERAKTLWPELLSESARLLEHSLTGDLPAQRAIGYREALLYLRHEMGEADAIAHLQQSTRRFAKRQMTWWRR